MTLLGTSRLLDSSQDAVQAACAQGLESLRERGLCTPVLQGQLIRPLLGYAGAAGSMTAECVSAWLAVQLAHEASLLHDDVIDGASSRRGQPTVAAARGIAAALVEGDHLLTTGYRVAAATRSLEFAELYARAVERTVAGERLQHERRGRVLSRAEYEEVVVGKSGELIGCAFAAAAVLRGDVRAPAFFEAGRRIGLCYQMVDDLLDYCEHTDSGKRPFADYEQRLWTWPLALLPAGTWPESIDALRAQLSAPDGSGRSVLMRAVRELNTAFAAVQRDVWRLLPQDRIVASLFTRWLRRAQSAVARQSIVTQRAGTRTLLTPAPGDVRTVGSSSAPIRLRPPRTPAGATDTPVLPGRAELESFFSRNSRSFSFAARLFPPAERARVADVYAFCRVTDDLVDECADGTAAAERLHAWSALCRQAYERGDTGMPTLDRVLRDAAGAGVPFAYVEELIAGMRMDLQPVRYESLAELRTYTHRVASVVGLWLTRLWGVHDPAVLERAADLGHALQLTNILRDVGEDWRRGRIYLPRDLMARYRVDEALLERMAAGTTPSANYRALLEELMAVADVYYQRAFAALPALPPPARRAVAVAAAVYRGIHAEIRAHGHDNLRRRAQTSTGRKLWLAVAGLWRLWRQPRFSSPGLGLQARAPGAGLAALLLALALALPASAQEGTVAHLRSVEARIAAEPGDSLLRLERVRALYFVAVEQEPQLKRASAAVTGLRRDYPGLALARAPLLQAYDGALDMLRAKHGSWPIARWQAARRGLRQLDAAVAVAPDDAEIRYLRLISCYYLPGLFQRGESVRQDFNALAELLPRAGHGYPREFIRAVARFVLEHAELDALARARLVEWEASLG